MFLFYISAFSITILTIWVMIRIFLLGSTKIKINVRYVRYKHLSEYANIIHYFIGLSFIISAYSIFKAVALKHEMVSSMFLWAGIIHIYNALRMGSTLYIREKGINHGGMFLQWKNIRECNFYSKYFVIEGRDGKINKFEVYEEQVDDLKKALPEKLTIK